jgi:hypothetical protein
MSLITSGDISHQNRDTEIVLKISKFANPNKLLEKFLDAASIL